MVASMTVMLIHIVVRGMIVHVSLLLVVLSYFIFFISTLINRGSWMGSIYLSLYTIVECIFLTSLIKREKEMYIYLLVVRDITLFFAIANLIVGIIMPQGIPSISAFSEHGQFLYGNVNSIMRCVMPGLCCSLIIDSKNGKKFSFRTILLFVSFFYFCFNIYFMATGFMGIITLIGWVIFRNIIKPNYKKAYLCIVVAVLFMEALVVFLFGKSEYGLLISGLFMKQGFSGREILWSNILYLIPKKLILGYGLMGEEQLLSFIGNSYGSHNYFLDVLFQRGVLGIIPLLLLFAIPLILKKREISGVTNVLLGVCCSYLVMFLMEPFIGTEFLHLPIFCITMHLLIKTKKTVES